MGNFGGLITARTDRLASLVSDSGLDHDDTWDLAGGWQTSQFLDPDFLRRAVSAIAEATGAPVIAAAFLDSDTGFVEAVTRQGKSWTAVLDRQSAEGYGAPLGHFPVKDAVRNALAWSEAAGLTADADLVRTAFTESRVLAEELYSILLVGLGIPGAELPESNAG